MCALFIEKEDGAPRIDGGSYVMRLVNIHEVQVDDFDHPGQKADRIELTFRILDPPGWQGTEFTDLCTPRLGPRSKLGQILTALHGGIALPNGRVDVETFVGKCLRANVRQKTNGYNAIVAESAVSFDAEDWEAPI